MIRKAILLGAVALMLPAFDTPITPLPEAEAVHIGVQVGYPDYYAYRYPAYRYRAFHGGYPPPYYRAYYPAYYPRPVVVRAYRAPVLAYPPPAVVYRRGFYRGCW